MTALLIVYLVGVVVFTMVCGAVDRPSDDPLRGPYDDAPIAFLAGFLWPVFLLVGVAVGVSKLLYAMGVWIGRRFRR